MIPLPQHIQMLLFHSRYSNFADERSQATQSSTGCLLKHVASHLHPQISSTKEPVGGTVGHIWCFITKSEWISFRRRQILLSSAPLLWQLMYYRPIEVTRWHLSFVFKHRSFNSADRQFICFNAKSITDGLGCISLTVFTPQHRSVFVNSWQSSAKRGRNNINHKIRTYLISFLARYGKFSPLASRV